MPGQQPDRRQPGAPLPVPGQPTQVQPQPGQAPMPGQQREFQPSGDPRSGQRDDRAWRDGNIDVLRQGRRERTEAGGRVIIEEPGNRSIIREGGRTIIRHDETERFRWLEPGARVEERGDRRVTIYRRPDGAEVITVVDRDGNLIRRSRRGPDGREFVLIENDIGPRQGPYYGRFVQLPPPVLRIPRDEYIVEAERASPVQIEEALSAPPIEHLERRYSLDEVRQSYPLLERMRSVDVNTITFASGAWQLTPDQYGRLDAVARGIQAVLSRNPNEVFLIEGHTDAVGSDVDNLSLSDRRAESVALLLTQQYQIPAENLTSQGYGEQYPRVQTQGPERLNRRVTVRRITPLLQSQQQQQ